MRLFISFLITAIIAAISYGISCIAKGDDVFECAFFGLFGALWAAIDYIIRDKDE